MEMRDGLVPKCAASAMQLVARRFALYYARAETGRFVGCSRLLVLKSGVCVESAWRVSTSGPLQAVDLGFSDPKNVLNLRKC